jgi:outer membrane protein assembly factor BamD (BamD/ComL family)
MPFPEAGPIHSNPHSTMSAAAVAGGGAAAAAAALPQPAARPVSLPRAKPGEIVRKTLDGVRAMPLWKTTIPAAVFFSLIGFALVALVIMVASIRSRAPSVPKVDTAAEARVARQRQLRNQANELLRDGNVADATKKFEELGKLAPKSPYVLAVNTKLTELRRQSESKQQQLVQAKQFFDQGMVLFNAQQYSDAVKAFDESFHLNPNSDEAATYLKLAQQEDERVRAEQAQKNPQLKSVVRPTVTPATTRGGPTRPATPPAPRLAQITTTFASHVTDGYIMVRIGGDVVAHENLWQETGRFLLRRHVPRDVNVSKEITPKSADLEIWVVIPSMNIQEHHTIRANFAPGSAHHLVVSFDPANKTFAYQMN